jgi:predicted HD superfamily hydrolase involved in NAD metabolism
LIKTSFTTSLIDLEQAKSWLAQRLSAERFEHSLGAQEKAVDLAEKFHLPQEETERVAIAALLHDAAKLMGPQQLIEFCESRGLHIEEMDRQTPQTLHPFVGAELVRQEFNIHDEAILDAIRYHTTGRSGMSRIEKVVYIADKIEGNTRNPLYVQKVTANLDYNILDSTIRFILDKNQVLHPRTVDARNDVLRYLKQEKHL